MKQIEFDQIYLHNGVVIEFDKNFPWKDEWKRKLKDIVKLAVKDSTNKYILRVIYVSRLSTFGKRELEKGIYVSKNSVLDMKYGLCIEAPENNILVIKTNNTCLEWLDWGLQLLFLSSGLSFIHGAAIEKNGKALIFPSWGGIGKTALVTNFVKYMNWKLLGDDMSLLSQNGTLYGFQKPMVLYPYHKDIFPDVFKSGKGPKAPLILNNLLTKLGVIVKEMVRPFPRLLQFLRKNNPQSIRINPSEVFGDTMLSVKATIKSVIWIDRVKGIHSPEIVEKEKVVSRIIGSTLNEYDPRCIKVTHIAMGLGIIKLEQFYKKWIDIITKGLDSIPQYIIYIPHDLKVSEVPKVVDEMLKKKGIYNFFSLTGE